MINELSNIACGRRQTTPRPAVKCLTVAVCMLLALPLLAATNATTDATDTEVTAVVEHIMKTLERGVLLVPKPSGRSLSANGPTFPHPSDKYTSFGTFHRQCSAITPYGWRAVPELLKWLDHKEPYMRYIAAYSLESITGLRPTFYYYATPHEAFNGDRNWFEKAKSTWNSWCEETRRKEAQPSGATNRSEAVHSETNSASAVAASFDMAQSKEALENLFAEVNGSGWEIIQSLPELKYAKGYHSFFGRIIETTNLLSADRRKFTVVVINCDPMSFPGNNFMLAYLRDPTGAIVDWKSQWLYNREGSLKTRILDVNCDGVPDFCFVCAPFRRPERLLSGFCVRDGKFDPVIVEHKSYFDIEFEETKLEEGIVIRPQQKRHFCQTEKLYEISVTLDNRSRKPVDLRGRYIWLSPRFSGSGSYGVLTNETLNPGGVIETVLTIRFTQASPDQRFRFELTPRHESP